VYFCGTYIFCKTSRWSRVGHPWTVQTQGSWWLWASPSNANSSSRRDSFLPCHFQFIGCYSTPRRVTSELVIASLYIPQKAKSSNEAESNFRRTCAIQTLNPVTSLNKGCVLSTSILPSTAWVEEGEVQRAMRCVCFICVLDIFCISKGLPINRFPAYAFITNVCTK